MWWHNFARPNKSASYPQSTCGQRPEGLDGSDCRVAKRRRREISGTLSGTSTQVDLSSDQEVGHDWGMVILRYVSVGKGQTQVRGATFVFDTTIFWAALQSRNRTTLSRHRQRIATSERAGHLTKEVFESETIKSTGSSLK